MSTINVSNLNDGTKTVATTYVTNGSAKAWLNMNGQGSIAINDSFNIASIVDNTTGTYQANFTNSMVNVSYSVTSSNIGDTQASYALSIQSGGSANTTNTYQVSCRNTVTNGILDPLVVNTTTHGDLA